MKPRVGVFSFTSCEGCQLQIVNLEDDILDLVEAIDLVTFREAMDPIGTYYDIAFVEGSITRESEIPILKEIRRKAKIVIANGACASTGGISGMKNQFTAEEVLKDVYGENGKYFDTIPSRGIDQVVKTDYYLRSCPVDKPRLVHLIKSLLLNKPPYDPDYPVCVECRMKENVCVFDLGEVCMGPVTRAGCGALCPSFGSACLGCRGFVEDANIASLVEVMQERGLSQEDAKKKLLMFNAARGVPYEQRKR